MSDLSGQFGVVVGIANRRSIAWAIAQAASQAGARLALTYQDDRLRENVEELAALTRDPLVLPCDVAHDQALDELFETIDREFGGLDFVVHGAAFAPKAELSVPLA